MFTNIVVATDGSALAGKAILAAADLAVKYGAELTVLHNLMHGEPPEAFRRMAEVEHLVADHPHLQTALDNVPGQLVSARVDIERKRLDHDVIVSMGKNLLQRAKMQAHEAGVDQVKGEVLEGDAAVEIIAAAEHIGADLIVLGTRGLGPLKGLLMGSISQKVSQMAKCACMIVK